MKSVGFLKHFLVFQMFDIPNVYAHYPADILLFSVGYTCLWLFLVGYFQLALMHIFGWFILRLMYLHSINSVGHLSNCSMRGVLISYALVLLLAVDDV